MLPHNLIQIIISIVTTDHYELLYRTIHGPGRDDRRMDADTTMRKDWDAWLAAHKSSVLNTIALGATKRVNEQGVEDVRNAMMLSSYVTAESLDAAAALFKGHPHLGIPGATIEIMEARQLSGLG